MEGVLCAKVNFQISEQSLPIPRLKRKEVVEDVWGPLNVVGVGSWKLVEKRGIVNQPHRICALLSLRIKKVTLNPAATHCAMPEGLFACLVVQQVFVEMGLTPKDDFLVSFRLTGTCPIDVYFEIVGI
eukprot:5963004-Amphidinium_carterae.1